MRNSLFGIGLLASVFLAPSPARAQWAPTGGPHGVFCRAFAAGGGSLYLADNLGVSQSIDQGETWQTIGPAFAPNPYPYHSGYPWGLVVRHDTLIVAGETGVHIRAGIGGEWKLSNAGLGRDSILNALIDAPEGLVALSWLGGVYRSADGGAHWENLNLRVETENAASLDRDGDVLYASTKHGVYRTRDQGRSWDRCAPLRPGGDSTAGYVACLHPYVFATYQGTSAYRSADSGSHWERIDSGFAPDSLHRWNLFVAGSRVYLTRNGKLFVSADSGKSWSAGSDFPYAGYVVPEAGIYAAGTDLFASSSVGVFRSRDGGATWKEADYGIGCCQTGELAAVGPGRMLAATESGMFASADQGSHWSYLPAQPYPIGSPVAPVGLGGQVLVSVPGFGFFRTLDGGGSWRKTPAALPAGDYPLMFPLGGELYYSAYPRGFARSTDSGQTWGPVPGWDKPGPRDMAYAAGTLYAIPGETTYVADADTLFRFDRGNLSWVAVRGGIHELDPIALGAKGGALLLGTFSQGLLASPDSGRTFSPIAGSRDWGVIRCILSADGDAYVGTDSGVAIGKAGTETWRLSNAGLPSAQPKVPSRRIYSLHAQDGFLFATTPMGIWKLPIGGGSAVRAAAGARKLQAGWIPVSGGIGFRGKPDSPLRSANGKLAGGSGDKGR